jgi:hypothetical protein
MGIANRDKDASEVNYVLDQEFGAYATGVTGMIGLVPSPGQLLELKVAGLGLSGAPTYALDILRWTSAGATVITLATVTLAGAFGLSGGAIGATFAANSSLAAVQAGDLLLVRSGVANTAVTHLAVATVIKATQDIKKTFDI